jgi:dephospho-CoA kinase
MLTLKKVAVTGGLACGKSTVCHFLAECGAYVISADQIVHQLLSPHTRLGKKVIQQLGSDVVVNDQFDREAIAKKVFNHAPLLQALEKILHPGVIQEINKIYRQVQKRQAQKKQAQKRQTQKEHKTSLFVVEIPLLFEIAAEKDYDAIITIVSDTSIAESRFTERTGLDASQFHERMARQLPIEEKAARANFVRTSFVIYNNGSLEELKQATEVIFNNLVALP